MTQQGTTRRTVLLGGMLAAIAGVIGLGSRPRPSATSSTLTLQGSDMRLSAPGLRRGDLPKRGDLTSVTGRLTVVGADESSGDFVGSVLHLDVGAAHGPYSSAQQETHTFHLADGTILGAGTTLLGRESVFVIIGGTGRYAGVSGTYSALQSPVDTGGDGTAEFTFTFNPRS